MTFVISSEKVTKVTEIIKVETDPKATEADVETHICADWENAEEHQEWIDTADAQEIADWISATVYS